jgi:hypothetical protein
MQINREPKRRLGTASNGVIDRSVVHHMTFIRWPKPIMFGRTGYAAAELCQVQIDALRQIE